jgi:hypothetical protein
MPPLTHLHAVREAMRLFMQLAHDIIDDSQPWQEPGRASPTQRLRCSYPSDTAFRQTYIQFRFGHEERCCTLDDFSHRLLRPSVEVLVAVISRDLDHKKICACRPILAVPDNWSGATVVLNGISMRLATANQGDPEREVTRLDALYGVVGRPA